MSPAHRQTRVVTPARRRACGTEARRSHARHKRQTGLAPRTRPLLSSCVSGRAAVVGKAKYLPTYVRNLGAFFPGQGRALCGRQTEGPLFSSPSRNQRSGYVLRCRRLGIYTQACWRRNGGYCMSEVGRMLRRAVCDAGAYRQASMV